MRIRLILYFLLFSVATQPSIRAREVLLVLGLGGEEEYTEIFRENISQWKLACSKAGVPCQVMGNNPGENELKEKLRARLAEVKDGELWLVLVGHGSFDGRVAKFNIAGDDFTAQELGEWCKPIRGNFVVINTTSASAPFLKELAGENRTVITATKSANEIFYSRFGEYFSKAIVGIKEADLDNDEQVSLLEAFLYSADRVKEFYTRAGRLATEHALIDDNGDGLGTRAEWFEGVTATKVAKDGAEPDGLRAMQQVLVPNELEKNFPPELRKRRDQLETEVRLLRRKKNDLEEEAYYRDLEALLKELAMIYRDVENAPPSVPAPKADPFGGGGNVAPDQ